MIMEYLDGVELKIDPVLHNGEMLTCSVKNRLNFASGLAMGFEMIKNQAALDYAMWSRIIGTFTNGLLH